MHTLYNSHRVFQEVTQFGNKVVLLTLIDPSVII